MKRIVFYWLFAVFFSACSTQTTENKTSENTTIAQEVSKTNTPSLEGKTFSLGMNLEPCDGLTYSEYTDEIFFHDAKTLTRTVSSAMEIGSPDFYMAISQTTGTYQWLTDSTLQINYIEVKFFEERNEEKILKETTVPQEKNETFLFSTDCPEGKEQLLFFPERPEGGSFSLKK